jgi:hypothetical protein
MAQANLAKPLPPVCAHEENIAFQVLSLGKIANSLSPLELM